MRDMPEDASPDGVPERLVEAAIRLLAEEGPSAIKARTVASATGLSTMVVYSHFGGIPELTRAVIDQGFKVLEAAFSQLPVTDDPIADLAVQALTCRRVARDNPHLYAAESGAIRIGPLHRFPYSVYYEELEDRIWVAAVGHHSRRPGYWARRKPN